MDDDVDDSEVIVAEMDSSDRSIPSMELRAVEIEAAELARFLRKDLQSPNESSSM